MGKDFNWDFRNYHYYNAFAFVTDRLTYDIAPGQMQTYLNPLLYVPFYWMVQTLPPWAVGFVHGFVQGLNIPLLFLVVWRLTDLPSMGVRSFVAVSVTMLGCIGPVFVAELGGTFYDNVLSIFVFAALLLLLRGAEKSVGGIPRKAMALFACAGLVMGLASGLKQTQGIFAIGLGFALLAMPVPWKDRLTAVFGYAAAGVVGGGIASGYWMWRLWTEFGNPLFPFFNQFFQSPYVAARAIGDPRFLPRSLADMVLWPFIFSRDSERVAGAGFVDIRFAVLYLSFIAYGLSRLAGTLPVRRRRTGEPGNVFAYRLGNMLLTFVAVSFVVWAGAFSIYRYLVPLELLAPFCVVLLIERLGLPSRWVKGILVLAALMTLAVFKPMQLGRLPWSGPYSEVDTSWLPPEGEVLVVMMGADPTSYLIPSFPRRVRFVRPEGNLELRETDLLYARTKNAIRDHKGPVYVLAWGEPEAIGERRLRDLGIAYRGEDCFRLKMNTPGDALICPAETFEEKGVPGPGKVQ